MSILKKYKFTKCNDYGYYILQNGLIHYFDDDYNFECSKIYIGERNDKKTTI